MIWFLKVEKKLERTLRHNTHNTMAIGMYLYL